MAIKKESDKRESSDSEPQTPPPFKKSKSTTTPQSTKWTETEIKELCDLRKAGMSFADMVKHFPDRTAKSLASCHQRNHKSVGEVFSEEKFEELRDAVENYQKRMWIHIGNEIGMSPAGCKKLAMERKLGSKT